MLIALASIKGSPGVTSTALALASVWPRPVVLLEADIAGGDLAYRCRATHGGSVIPSRGILSVAAAVRGGSPSANAVWDASQLLGCGVNLIQGVTSSAQARGLSALWLTIAEACTGAPVDVLADLGRVDRMSAQLPVAQAADYLLPVASATLESVMHLSEGLSDLASGMAGLTTLTTTPVLVGPDAHAGRDCADLDDLLARTGLPLASTRPMPNDHKALRRLEVGERAEGRLGRTLLLRAARTVVGSLHHTDSTPGASA